MATSLTRGPGWFQAFNDGQLWVDNWDLRSCPQTTIPQRLGLVSFDEIRKLDKGTRTLRNVYVMPGQTVQNVLDIMTANRAPDKTPAVSKPAELPRSIVPGSFRPYVEGLTKDQVIGMLNEGAAELIRRDLIEKESEDRKVRTAPTKKAEPVNQIQPISKPHANFPGQFTRSYRY